MLCTSICALPQLHASARRPEAGVSTAEDRLRSKNVFTTILARTRVRYTFEMDMGCPPRASPPGIDDFGSSQARRSSVRAVGSPATLDHISGPGVQSTSSDNFHGRKWKRGNMAPADQMAPGRLNAEQDPPLGSPKKSPVKSMRDSPASDFFGPSTLPFAGTSRDLSPQCTQRSMARVELEKQVRDQVSQAPLITMCH